MMSQEALSSQKGQTQISPGFQLLGPICLPLVVAARCMWGVGTGSVKPKHVSSLERPRQLWATTLACARIPTQARDPLQNQISHLHICHE